MKKTLFLIIGFLVMLSASAQEKSTYNLVVELRTNLRTILGFAEEPNVKCEGQDLVITSKTRTLKFEIAEVKRLTPSSSANDIEEIEADSKFSFEKDQFSVSSLKEGETCIVYDAQGRMVSNAKAGKDGKVEVNTSKLGHGVYVVKTKNVSFKIKQ